jgi:uncharacterized protein YjbI with pentapeptide repeats
MAVEQPHWERCSQDGCTGVRLPATAWCLAHAAEQAPDAFDAELKRISAEGSVDARGVVISAELLERLLAAVPRKDDRPIFTAARFDQASFQGRAVFDTASFQDWTRFDGASFQGLAGFEGASFQGRAVFDTASFQDQAGFVGASFHGQARFDGASFQDRARFDGARFQRVAGFNGARFQRVAVFYKASFQDEAWFRRVSFQDQAIFDKASFQGLAGFERTSFQAQAGFEGASFQDWTRFNWASFEGRASFEEASFQRAAAFDTVRFQGHAGFVQASFQGTAWFGGASFERASHIGPLLARQLVLDGAVFGARVQLDVTAAALCARGAQFPAGVHLRLRYATVDLDDADLTAPAILAGVPSPFPELESREQQVSHGWERLPPGPRQQRWRPRMLSVRRANVAGLRLADVDLRACRFAGAHNLDRLRIEGAPLFARTPGWWRARRKTLAEEQHWRATRPGRWRPGGWYPLACQPPASPKAEAPAVEPTRLAALYRELRKGREDAKDEPGAADFYYGECEMRRHGAPLFSIERWILTLYWLVSGYALRASRAIIAWMVLVVFGTAIFAGIGFKHPMSPQIIAVDVSSGKAIYEKQDVPRPSSLEQVPEALAFSAESTVSLLRAPDRALTLPGRWAQMILRILGPVLFGLAVLSLRGRVRR